MPSLSVVIPALDDAEMLARCLDDLAAQLRPADEIIVVDNGSSDGTADVARAAGARVVEQPQRGIWPAASTGYDAATGDIIARLDADSRPPADWLLHIEAELVDAPEVGVLTGRGVFYDGNTVVAGLGQVLYIGGYFWSMGIWLGNPPIFGSNFAMRREVWLDVRDRVHRDRGDIHDDLDLAFHLSLDTVVRYDERLTVGISARPFSTWRGFGRRLRWAYTTLSMHLPDQSPWRRRIARRRLAHDRERDAPGAVA
ncbi:Glycosyl transferase family 2 [Leifsonia sp. 98AMF]|uniref:glycosyltransferase n=1 Tax=Microbacteriaceae TaxID=85023 RepID=UPI00036D3AC6|nr:MULTISPECIES: glycosyltransferase family 2 protein [Microbacteriaceae]TDQ03245.1 glycosyl transferase family 2 [Leifsonia sp. 115AMFTsu3.1]SDH26445.1 Glycosyl transferase family 2 [Leifsonia sp. 197AMF]SDJ12122.1 Glycosyl transferase family 2 [Leifsonia sp. 466MF]SDJ57337.1 Glycosyl transferase family 2 [Leifsonia sp. 157MF]SDN33604.1 Glycosyl transferase family 2 [Leifsonia sp. 509MF]